MSTTSTLDGLREAGVVGLLRAPSHNGAIRAAEALVAGRIRAIEITCTTLEAGTSRNSAGETKPISVWVPERC